MQRVYDLDAPDRCTHHKPGEGQCPMQSVPNYNRCEVHGGVNQLQINKKQELRAYMANRWRAEIKSNASDSEIKSLREELGIARIMLDQLLNRCKDSHDLLLMSTPIDNMLKTITLIQKNSHLIEKDLNNIITPESLEEFGNALFNIIMEEVQDSNTINRISMKIMKELRKVTNAN